jgi:hypothetical protein
MIYHIMILLIFKVIRYIYFLVSLVNVIIYIHKFTLTNDTKKYIYLIKKFTHTIICIFYYTYILLFL